MVLATDMTKHFEHLSKFVNMSGNSKTPVKDDDAASLDVSVPTFYVILSLMLAGDCGIHYPQHGQHINLTAHHHLAITNTLVSPLPQHHLVIINITIVNDCLIIASPSLTSQYYLRINSLSIIHYLTVTSNLPLSHLHQQLITISSPLLPHHIQNHHQ